MTARSRGQVDVAQHARVVDVDPHERPRSRAPQDRACALVAARARQCVAVAGREPDRMPALATVVRRGERRAGRDASATARIVAGGSTACRRARRSSRPRRRWPRRRRRGSRPCLRPRARSARPARPPHRARRRARRRPAARRRSPAGPRSSKSPARGHADRSPRVADKRARSLSPPKRAPRRRRAGWRDALGPVALRTPDALLRQQPEPAVAHDDRHACALVHAVVVGRRDMLNTPCVPTTSRELSSASRSALRNASVPGFAA